jgi:hypothetical protein
MVTRLTDLGGGIARVFLSAAVLFFNGPRLLGSDAWTHPAPTDRVDTRTNSDVEPGFHATVTVGKGKKQVTVELEFGRPGERAEDESL